MAFGLVLSALAGNGPGGDQQNDTFPLEREIRHDGYHVSIPVSPDTAYIIQPSFGAIDHGGDGSNHHYTWNSDCHEKDCVTIVVGDTTKQWPKSPTGINCFSDRDEAFNAWTGTCVVVTADPPPAWKYFLTILLIGIMPEVAR